MKDNLNPIPENNQLSTECDEILSTGTVKTIYVGHSNTSEGGDGSKENPYIIEEKKKSTRKKKTETDKKEESSEEEGNK